MVGIQSLNPVNQFSIKSPYSCCSKASVFGLSSKVWETRPFGVGNLEVGDKAFFFQPKLKKRDFRFLRLAVGCTAKEGDDDSLPNGKRNEKKVNGSHSGKYNGHIWSSNKNDASNGSTNSEIQKPGEQTVDFWENAFPTYLQSKDELEDNSPLECCLSDEEVIDSGEEALVSGSESGWLSEDDFPSTSVAAFRRKVAELREDDPVWKQIREEAKVDAEQEPLLSSYLYASILAHRNFERSLGFVLANRLQDPTMLATQLQDIFDDCLMDEYVRHAIRADVQAFKDRDPSCASYSSALLYNKGYHALQAYRIAHTLWTRGQKILALSLQSRISEVFAVDIHPAARIGYGILLDHATGLVIGETAIVKDRVSLLQGVTLGGTGKDSGDRHPKVMEGVLIGAGATILGNILVGKGSMIAAGSLVLKDVPPHSMVAGSPAKVVGKVEEPAPSLTMKHDATKKFCDFWDVDGFTEEFVDGAGV